LAARNPRLIYAAVTGLGPEGPERGRPVLDAIGQARSGIMSTVDGPDGTPSGAGLFGLADQCGAWMMVHGILAALVARERFGLGQRVEASQLGSMMALQTSAIERALVDGRPSPKLSRTQVGNPLWNRYQGNDDRWFVLGCLQPDRYWPAVCAVIERPDLVGDPRFADEAARRRNGPALVALLDEGFESRSACDWVEAFAAAGVVTPLVQAYRDLPDDPQVRANRYLVDLEHPALGPTQVVRNPLNFSATPVHEGGAAPELGQQTEEVLLEAGFSWDEIGAFRDQGVI